MEHALKLNQFEELSCEEMLSVDGGCPTTIRELVAFFNWFYQNYYEDFVKWLIDKRDNGWN